MAEVISPLNDTTQGSLKLDGVWLTTSDDGLHKKAIAGTAAAITGVATGQAATQQVGTHLDDGTFTPGSEVVTAIAGVADETSADSVSEGDVGALRMTLARNLHVVSVCDAATLSNVASTASSTTIIAAEANRIGLVIVNDDANTLYIKYGATASTSSYTYQIPGNGGTFEMPAPVYRGIIDGIWSADGSGSARVTQLT